MAFGATVVVLMALLYPLSSGPACWLVSRLPEDPEFFKMVYLPIAWLRWTDKPVLGDATAWYGELLMSPVGTSKSTHCRTELARSD